MIDKDKTLRSAGNNIIRDRACENRACGFLILFKPLALITFYSNMVQPKKFLGLLIIYLAL